MRDYLSIHPEVAEALAAGQPVVALESTIVAHGMPYPQNLETAQTVENIIREHGAIPATIAVLDGRIRVGLDPDDLERLANSGNIAKLSRRDMAAALTLGQDGATTVSATMIGAHLSGISVFATGGIGGVHRGAETSFDISADLEELARTPVAVVCAGAKSILDLPKTLEYLETRGVPVLGLGTEEFPAFYARTSGLKVDRRIDDAETAARILRTHWQLGFESGPVIAVPVPETDALSPTQVDSAITQALNEADQQGIGGKAVTPFLLARIAKLTNGASLKANIALIKNNAARAAEIAAAYARLERETALPRKLSGGVRSGMKAF